MVYWLLLRLKLIGFLLQLSFFLFFWGTYEVVCVTIGNPAFGLTLYLTGVHFWGELQHVGDVNEQKIKFWSIRTPETGGVRLSDELYISRSYLGR